MSAGDSKSRQVRAGSLPSQATFGQSLNGDFVRWLAPAPRQLPQILSMEYEITLFRAAPASSNHLWSGALQAYVKRFATGVDGCDPATVQAQCIVG